jgi:hypothetical protein
VRSYFTWFCGAAWSSHLCQTPPLQRTRRTSEPLRGIAAISALARMFSKQAPDKLREIFDTLFRAQEPVSRADPLIHAKPVVFATEPATLAVRGSPTLTALGRNFQRDCAASINGKSCNAQWISEGRIVLTLVAEDLTVGTELHLIIHNLGPGGEDSEPFRIRVAGAGATR